MRGPGESAVPRGGVCSVPVAGGGGGGPALGDGGEGASRAGRARADAGSAAHSCPRVLATFRGVCATPSPPSRF